VHPRVALGQIPTRRDTPRAPRDTTEDHRLNRHANDIDRRFEELKQQGAVAPPPDRDDIPMWLRDGVENLYDFFNGTAEVWDQKFGPGSEPFYEAVAAQLPATEEPLRILILGCGTGLELDAVFARTPNARITGIDLAPNMLEQLRGKFAGRMAQITLVLGNYLDLPLGEGEYDHAISTLTVHHLPWEMKAIVYRKTWQALRPGGTYIEGDQSCLPEQEDHRWYHEFVSKLPGGDRGDWNYDVTLSVETNTRLLAEAGFSDIRQTWEARGDDGYGHAVLVARR